MSIKGCIHPMCYRNFFLFYFFIKESAFCWQPFKTSQLSLFFFFLILLLWSWTVDILTVACRVPDKAFRFVHFAQRFTVWPQFELSGKSSPGKLSTVLNVFFPHFWIFTPPPPLTVELWTLSCLKMALWPLERFLDSYSCFSEHCWCIFLAVWH